MFTIKHQAQTDQSGQELTEAGKRLALLLAASDFTDEEKEAMAILIPQMSFEQIDRLTKIVEARVSGGVSKEFAGFKTGLEKVEAAHQANVAAADAAAMSALDDLASQIK